MKDTDYSDLYFTRGQLMLSAEEAAEVALELMSRSCPTAQITDRDRAFVQRALLIVVDLSEKSSAWFDLFATFMTKAPSGSVARIVKGLAKKSAKRWFKKYIDETPKYNAAGKSGFLYYSQMPIEWRVRISLNDPSMITNYLIEK